MDTYRQSVNLSEAHLQRVLLTAVLLCLVPLLTPAFAQSSGRTPVPVEIRVLEIQGSFEIMPAGATTWVATQATNQVLHVGDRLRTGSNSRVTLRWSDQSVVPFGALSEIEILPPDKPDSLPGINLLKGILSFFHRDRPGRIKIITRGANASVEGTEFVMEMNAAGRATFSVIDGTVQVGNGQHSLLLTNNQQAVVDPGTAPVRTAGFVVNDVLQWCFYYPAVLDLRDLTLGAPEQQALQESLDLYRAGDLLGALAKYPAGRRPASDSERIYHAALLLSVGDAKQTEAELAALPAGADARVRQLADSLRTLIAAVKRQPKPSTIPPQLSSELLAASYAEQARATGDESLRAALELARRATVVSPEFGFAWCRVAELEFGFGHTARALEALNRSLTLSPRNAQSLALKGFLLAAENKIGPALEWFDRAIAVDAALGNAWLGRGLCRIRRGDAAAGREDLLIAAALEPQRALLRSYLGKAFADGGDLKRADKELHLALQLDPGDPTGWLYLALIKQQENRINESIKDLETSQERNDNRSLFRSQLLLDQDRAVGSANLATVFRDAGMTDVSVREAARAVTYDYANHSAHLFLADSYNELRDPTRFNLRYETVWFNEYLLANMLAPVGAGRLSQHISQQEYSPLFEANGLGLASSTLARSDGVFRQLASQYGTFDTTSWSLDLDYQHNDGVRPNNDLKAIEWYTTVKQQITPKDTLILIVKYQDYSSGDNFQYYDPTNARPNFRFDESQKPIVLGGWHHEWAPGVHTLHLGGRLENDQTFSDVGARQLMVTENAAGQVYASDTRTFDIHHQIKLEIYTGELNQIVQWNRFTLVAGARVQSGQFETDSLVSNPPPGVAPLFNNPPSSTSFTENFQRVTGYGYLTVEPIDRLWLTAGLCYDTIQYPTNFRQPPVSPGEDRASQLGPKASLAWSPLAAVTLRGFYAQSLGGASLDESYRLEPVQLAGFPQTFRTLIPESVVGSVTAPEFETMGVAVDLKLGPRTYAGAQFQHLTSNVQRQIGVFTLQNGGAPFVADTTLETLDYQENSVQVSINQLLNDGFVVGASYRYSRAELTDVLPQVPVAALPSAYQNLQATLQETSAYLLFNHPSGFFARVDVTWYHQQNSGYTPALPGDDFVQENLLVGWFFFKRRLQIQAGILNLSGQDYHLNPLNAYSELPRERTYMGRVNFQF